MKPWFLEILIWLIIKFARINVQLFDQYGRCGFIGQFQKQNGSEPDIRF